MIGQREQTTTVSYPLGDHLGSASVVADHAGTVLSYQRYLPYGEVRDGATTATTLNFTGQRKDDSGLLFYNARYYDPVLARFISADTVVPDSGALTMQALDVTEALHWGKDRVGTPNPSTLNRYAYVQNNPMRYVDPSGHVMTLNKAQASILHLILASAIIDIEALIRDAEGKADAITSVVGDIATIGSAIADKILKDLGESGSGLANIFAKLGSLATSDGGYEALNVLKMMDTCLESFAMVADNDDIIALWVDYVYDRGFGSQYYFKAWWQTDGSLLPETYVKEVSPNTYKYLNTVIGDEMRVVKGPVINKPYPKTDTRNTKPPRGKQ